MVMTKRVNLLKYFDVLANYEKDEIEAILFSIIEHRVSDLGFSIDTKTVDLKNYMYGPHQELITTVSTVVKNALLTVTSDYAAEIITLDKYVYDIRLTKED